MNTSTRISFAGVTAALIIVAFCFSACPNKDLSAVQGDEKFFLKLGKKENNVWVDVTSQDDFNKALIKLEERGGKINISYLCKDGTQHDQYDPKHPQMCEKTSPDRSPTGDPNATQHVRANSAQDLEDLLKTFKEP
jgi:hypothetical protein